MAVLSEYYRQQLQEVHRTNTTRPWGTTGARNFGDYIVKFLEHRRGQIHSVLDFGAGQGSLGRYVQENAVDVQVKWTDYDPGVQGKDEYPEEPFDLVVSSDVLEHIEPDFLEGTLAELRVLARKAQFHHIACDPSKGRLPDGRDMHLITEKLDWWLPRFEHPEWSVMYTAQCAVRKRGELRNHCHIQLDRV